VRFGGWSGRTRGLVDVTSHSSRWISSPSRSLNEDQQAASAGSRSLEGARHAYAAATLLDVNKAVAALFRSQ
jgi:hypothetical protein